MNIKKSISILAIGIFMSLSVMAQVPTKTAEGYLLNLDQNGCMLQGYDCVAMVIKPNETIKGNSTYESTYQNAKYWFESASNKALFDADPAKYAPLYGGFCAVAITEGNLRPIQVWTHHLTEGHLVVNHNAKAKKLWERRERKRFKTAEKNWPTVTKKDAKYDIIHTGETQESIAKTSFDGPK
jgi:YHS domain-containing protein